MSTADWAANRMTYTTPHLILVVEDDADSAQFLKELLEKNQYKVMLAKDGGQAKSSFIMHKPDVVILDIILPGESGFEICERMKQEDESIPVLFLSVIDMPDARNLAERVGANGFFTKPFDPDELLTAIPEIAQKVWEKNHLSDSKQEHRIRFNCKCGKKFKVSPVHRGRTLTCPGCGETVVVPRHG
ncbi:MAG: PleD family two-component system response regulator [Planctomycetaceae bacterium]